MLKNFTIAGVLGLIGGVTMLGVGGAKSTKALSGSKSWREGRATLFAGVAFFLIGAVLTGTCAPLWSIGIDRRRYGQLNLDLHHELRLAERVNFFSPPTVNVAGWSGRF